ncbi:MAG TPA: hypothetical protein VGI94_17925 [Reyranella sp.]
MRISVADALEYLAVDMRVEEILSDFPTWNAKTFSLALPTRQNESVNAGQGHSPHKLLFDDSHGSPNTIEQVLRSRVQVTDAAIADDIGSSIISHARLPARCLRSIEGRTHHAVWRPR